MATPSDYPPSYEQAVKGGPDALPHEQRNGIPLRARRSMEDELRPLPQGWVREYDPETQHQFFVDTMASPPRSIWHHPYDDDVYLASLPPQEHETILSNYSASHRRPSCADIVAEDTDDVDSDAESTHSNKSKGDRIKSLGRRLKDHLTGTTHEQRAADRARRAEAERELYRQHRVMRQAMLEAMRTGRPQPLGRDENGTQLFLEPPGHTFPGVARVRRLSPYLSEVVYESDDGSADGRSSSSRPGPPGRYLRPEGDMYGMGYGAYGCGRFAGGRWDRPGDPYRRVEGRGYGGGLGFPLMMPLVGGMMLGGMMGSVF
ncbi:hypothetical protein N657DRAFT_623385 [Parathielavia appendiculata]|uniref:WW domain-containing protein n=1 Tax=Parathielavia appendiculata TaxID=2587402 RepID=A0AAN6TUY0_9PEZI|nr:hypothetical protein N657DRAFT_623385 [Parathielavia appendiculata]